MSFHHSKVFNINKQWYYLHSPHLESDFSECLLFHVWVLMYTLFSAAPGTHSFQQLQAAARVKDPILGNGHRRLAERKERKGQVGALEKNHYPRTGLGSLALRRKR